MSALLAIPVTPQQIAVFTCLTTKHWKKDKGYVLAIAQNPGTIMFHEQIIGPGRIDAVAYWRKEKGDYPLWQLLLYMGKHTVPQTLEYFGLPADTREFLSWVSDHVAHGEPERVPKMKQGIFGVGFDQMNHFPYATLYQVWRSEDDAQRAGRVPKGNVEVYLDRITEPSGEVLAII